MSKYLILTSVLFLSSLVTANAQVADNASIKAHIPNSFIVRDKVLPPGDYTIKRTSSSADSASLLILQGEGATVVFDTNAAISYTAAKETKLVFGKADNMLYLSEIWVKGGTVGNRLTGARADAFKVAKARAAKAKGDTTGF